MSVETAQEILRETAKLDSVLADPQLDADHIIAIKSVKGYLYGMLHLETSAKALGCLLPSAFNYTKPR